jgi:glycerol-3-phosphate dehydrogenase (NAD(P)+)
VTLAWLLRSNGHSVNLCVRSETERESVQTVRGVARLPDVELDAGVVVHTGWPVDPGVDGIVLAVPAQAMRATLSSLEADRSLPILCAAKGIEHGTARLMSEVAADCGWPSDLVAVLSGPNLAHEIARGLPAAAVVAASRLDEAQRWQKALSTGSFRVYTSNDVVGVELAGALKNVIAIAAGAAVGLGMGANTVATIVTRGLAEITRLGVALGADASTFQGLAGVGDLAATCYSPLSRNRQLGELLATGRTAEAALAEIGETAEGAATASVAVSLGRRHGVELPITDQVSAVLLGEASVAEAMSKLLTRSPRSEANGWD